MTAMVTGGDSWDGSAETTTKKIARHRCDSEADGPSGWQCSPPHKDQGQPCDRIAA